MRSSINCNICGEVIIGEPVYVFSSNEPGVITKVRISRTPQAPTLAEYTQLVCGKGCALEIINRNLDDLFNIKPAAHMAETNGGKDGA